MARYRELKEQHRALRPGWPQPFSLRIHRALSWLDRAEQFLGASPPDHDGGFIMLWISFNAAYAGKLGAVEKSEKIKYKQFFTQLAIVDRDHRLHDALWRRYSNEIRVLLNNQFVFQPFWDALRKPSILWEKRLKDDNRAAHEAIVKGAVPDVLKVVFSRLYTLRNQLVHGCATWQGKVNRDQLRDACAILGWLVPLIIELMMNNPEEDWGEIEYPVIAD